MSERKAELYENPVSKKSLGVCVRPWAGSTLKEMWVNIQQFCRFASRWVSLFSCVVAISACSLAPPGPVEMPLPQNEREARLQHMQQFSLDASIGVKSTKDSVSGSLEWRQTGNNYQAAMRNVLGLTVFELTNTTTGATVVVDGKTHRGDSAGELLNYLSGWSLPIEEMPLWIRGLPSLSSQNLQRDSLGRVQSFTLIDSQQRQWQVTYTEFFADSLSLPRKMTLQSADSRLKLVIREWTL